MNPHFGNKNSQNAYNATTSPTWLLDSGASSHMTNSYTNLQNPKPYNGPEQVYVGDGKSLPILNSGSLILTLPLIVLLSRMFCMFLILSKI